MNNNALVEILYTAGVVFDNLSSSRLASRKFLTSGDTSGMSSKMDVMLLEDLQAGAQTMLAYKASSTPPSSKIARELNACLTQTASLHPGKLRQDSDGIGVTTAYGRHEPPALTDHEFDLLIQEATNTYSSTYLGCQLFVRIARAQPFLDGNKRTAILLANLVADSSEAIIAPYNENDRSVSTTFMDMLGRAYILDEIDACADYMYEHRLTYSG